LAGASRGTLRTMAHPLIDGTASLSPTMRIAICAALMVVSGWLVGDEVHLQVSGDHVVARVSEIEIVRGSRGRSHVRTHLQFTEQAGTSVSCQLGDIHSTVGRMVAIRYLPPHSCAVAGDFRGIAIFGSFGLIGAVGIVWTMARRGRR
jgi:hypothetical protein